MSLYLNQRNKIAATDIEVSPLGLGTVKLGRNTAVKYPQSFTIPDDRTALALLDHAWHSGINLLDTAPAYGNSEQRLGELLPQLKHDFVISTKVGEQFNANTGESSYDFTPESIIHSVQQSLIRLKKEALDIVMLHSDGNDEAIIQQGALEVLHELKQQGLIRATGMSTKTVTGGIQTLQQADIAMVMHHIDYQQEQAVLDFAAQNHKAIFIKKALASGHISSASMQDNFNFIFQHNAVTSIIVGTVNPSHLDDNIANSIAALATAS